MQFIGSLIKERHVSNLIFNSGIVIRYIRNFDANIFFITGITISGLRFYNFDEDRTYAIALVKIHCLCSYFCGGYRAQFWNMYFDATVTKRATFEWKHQYDLEDMDGTLTGVVPTAEGNAHVVAMSPIYDSTMCTISDEWTTGIPFRQNTIKGAICRPGVYFARMGFSR